MADKSDRQVRAERAAVRFTECARKAVVIEFAGMPKAGKTTTLANVHAFFKRCGFRVETVVERASVCPIRDKKHANFNIWTACTTLAQLLEKTQEPPRIDDPQILFLDRGLFDSLIWLTTLQRLARLRAADHEKVERFMRIEDWRGRITGVIVMTVSPVDALEREQGYLPVEGGKGSIMNREVLEQIRNTIKDATSRMNQEFRLFPIDTSAGETKGNPRATAEKVADVILSIIEEQIRENILSLPKKQVESLFQGKRFLSGDEAERLSQLFVTAGDFMPREEVEADTDRIQALPVVVVRNASGEILRLRRKERSEDNPLHDQVVIWAGGHVRDEDGANGHALLRCAKREIKEELRLDVEPDELKLVGAIYVDVGGKTSHHVAVCYEWRARTDDIAVALSSTEFHERRGTSVSGSFVAPDVVVKSVRDGKIQDPWSIEIVEAVLAGKPVETQRRLL